MFQVCSSLSCTEDKRTSREGEKVRQRRCRRRGGKHGGRAEGRVPRVRSEGSSVAERKELAALSTRRFSLVHFILFLFFYSWLADMRRPPTIRRSFCTTDSSIRSVLFLYYVSSIGSVMGSSYYSFRIFDIILDRSTFYWYWHKFTKDRDYKKCYSLG